MGRLGISKKAVTPRICAGVVNPDTRRVSAPPYPLLEVGGTSALLHGGAIYHHKPGDVSQRSGRPRRPENKYHGLGTSKERIIWMGLLFEMEIYVWRLER